MRSCGRKWKHVHEVHTVGLVDTEIHQHRRCRVKHGPVHLHLKAGEVLQHGARWGTGRAGVKHRIGLSSDMFLLHQEIHAVLTSRGLGLFEIGEFVHGMIGVVLACHRGVGGLGDDRPVGPGVSSVLGGERHVGRPPEPQHVVLGFRCCVGSNHGKAVIVQFVRPRGQHQRCTTFTQNVGDGHPHPPPCCW